MLSKGCNFPHIPTLTPIILLLPSLTNFGDLNYCTPWLLIRDNDYCTAYCDMTEELNKECWPFFLNESAYFNKCARFLFSYYVSSIWYM